jgi:hypothetical protein
MRLKYERIWRENVDYYGHLSNGVSTCHKDFNRARQFWNNKKKNVVGIGDFVVVDGIVMRVATIQNSTIGLVSKSARFVLNPTTIGLDCDDDQIYYIHDQLILNKGGLLGEIEIESNVMGYIEYPKCKILFNIFSIA